MAVSVAQRTEYLHRKPSDAAMLVVHSLGDRRLCCSSQIARALLCSFDVAHARLPLLSVRSLRHAESINQCTGCATSCEGLGCEPEAHYFMRPANRAIGVKAVTELAKLCEAAGEVCFGVELLNEPAQPEPLGGGNCNRTELLDYYHKAIAAVRSQGGLSPSKPVVIMDWPSWLNTFWNEHAPRLSASPGVGSLLFETHFYSHHLSRSLHEYEASALPQILALRRFEEATGLHTFVGEWALSNIAAPLTHAAVARWWYRNLANVSSALGTSNGLSLGLTIWNFDGPGGWGGVRPNNENARDFWKDVNGGDFGEHLDDRQRVATSFDNGMMTITTTTTTKGSGTAEVHERDGDTAYISFNFVTVKEKIQMMAAHDE